MTPRTINTREDAQNYAKEWSMWISEVSISYGELYEWQQIFEELAERFDLVDEFKENAII